MAKQQRLVYVPETGPMTEEQRKAMFDAIRQAQPTSSNVPGRPHRNVLTVVHGQCKIPKLPCGMH